MTSEKRKSKKKQPNKHSRVNPQIVTFVAGCKRTATAPSDLAEIAYDALEYPECKECIHRLEPDSAHDNSKKNVKPFCVWHRQDKPHPFAALKDFLD